VCETCRILILAINLFYQLDWLLSVLIIRIWALRLTKYLICVRQILTKYLLNEIKSNKLINATKEVKYDQCVNKQINNFQYTRMLVIPFTK